MSDYLEVPETLDFPDKLMQILEPETFNKYRIFIIDGGRGSAKTQSVARFLLYLAEQIKLRIIGAREQQNSIEESVYTVFKDLIDQNELAFEVQKSKITHLVMDSTIGFKGLREQGAVNVKGLEGVDIVWVDEAQSLTKPTLDILIPTIRKKNSKLFFTLNRFIREDPVMALVGRPDVLHIHIDYFENPHCTDELKIEAAESKKASEQDYNHIWLGQPLPVAEDYLFNFDKLAAAEHIEPIGDLWTAQSVLAIDFASGGGDLCVASLIRRISTTQWELAEQHPWDNPDTDVSVGKSFDFYGEFKPDIFIVDKGGLGYPMFCTLSKKTPVIGFDGAETSICKINEANHRAAMYFLFKEWVDKGWIRIRSKKTIKDCETIRKKHFADGKIHIESKKDAKKRGVKSQDFSDSVGMAIFGAVHFLGKVQPGDQPIGMRIQRVNNRKPI